MVARLVRGHNLSRNGAWAWPSATWEQGGLGARPVRRRGIYPQATGRQRLLRRGGRKELSRVV